MQFVRRLIQEEDGQGYMEYLVLIALVVIVVAVSAGFISGAIGNYMSRIGNAINNGTVSDLTGP